MKYKSSLDGLLTIIKEEGVEGLYKGIGSKIVQSVLTAAILFAGQRRIFEATKAVRTLSPGLKHPLMDEPSSGRVSSRRSQVNLIKLL